MKRPVLIHIAMEAELSRFLTRYPYEKKTQNGWNFYEHLNEAPYFVIVSGAIGMVETASALTCAVMTYQPVAVLNGGLAGGHGADIRRYDLVIGEDCIPITSFQTPKREKGAGCDALSWELTSYHEGAKNSLNRFPADAKLLRLAKKLCGRFPCRFHTGTIGSGDTWNREYDYIEHLHSVYHTLCEDMEAAAVYQTAARFRIPALSVKCISNNEQLHQEYDRECAQMLSEFLIAMLEELKEYPFS